MRYLASFLFSLLLTLNAVGAEPMTDEEFQTVLDGLRYSGGGTYMKIAKSGHPEAMNVLRALDDMPAGHYQSTFEKFTELYGYSVDAPQKAQMMIDKEALNTALAAAGDEAAYNRIIEEFYQESNSEEDWLYGSNRESAFKKLEQIGDDRAVRFIANRLDMNELNIRGDTVSSNAASHLERMVDNPAQRVSIPGNSVEETSAWIENWKKWWIDNGHDYGATDEEIAKIRDSISYAQYAEDQEGRENPEETPTSVESSEVETSGQTQEPTVTPVSPVTEITKVQEPKPKTFPWLWIILSVVVIAIVIFFLIQKQRT